jgi:hypothetical protein
MSSKIISSSKLDLLDDCIKVFLHKYKEVFGMVALANSKVDLKKIKFHAAKHVCSISSGMVLAKILLAGVSKAH